MQARDGDHNAWLWESNLAQNTGGSLKPWLLISRWPATYLQLDPNPYSTCQEDTTSDLSPKVQKNSRPKPRPEDVRRQYTCTCAQKSLRAKTCACIHTYTHTNAYVYAHTRIRTYLHTHVHTHVHTQVHSYIALHYITLHYITLHYITVQYSKVQYSTFNALHYITLPFVTLHYTTLFYITLHCITSH